MTGEADDIRTGLQHPHDANRAAGPAVTERSARADLRPMPTDDAIRRKAYECWEARGRVHGRDREDWFEALEALRRPALPDGAPLADTDEPSSNLLSVAVRAAGSLMLGAAHAMDGFLGLGEPKKGQH